MAGRATGRRCGVSGPGNSSGARVERIWRALLARRGDVRALLDFIDTLHVPIVLIGNDHGYREANTASRLFLRRTMEELRSLTTYDLVPVRQRAAFAARWEKLLRDGEVAASTSMRPPDGAEIAVDYRAAANMLPGLHVMVLLPSTWLTPSSTTGSRNRPDQPLRA
jgi:hypothetical protein